MTRLASLALGFRRMPRWLALTGIAFLGLFLLVSGIGTAFDQSLQALRFSLRSHPASGEVHVVEIDARSLQHIARWPWPRSVHAQLVDRLREAGARSIAFDVDFSSPTDVDQDRAFAAALERAQGNVILPTFRQTAGSGTGGYVDNLPIGMLADRAFLGAVNIVPDADGSVRRMLLGVETAGTARPSLPSLTAGAAATIGEEFDIDYAVDPRTIPRHSVIDILDGRLRKGALEGKRVIVGATAIEMGDRYTVPRHGVLHGVVIQAIAAETLLKGRVPQRWGGLLPLVAAFLIVAAIGRAPRPRHLLLVGAAMVALLGAPLVAEMQGVSFAIAPALAVLLCGAVIAIASIAAEREQRRHTTDAGTGLPNLLALDAALKAKGPANIVVAHIDNFAVIASGLGGDAVAQLMLQVAARLRRSCTPGPIYRTDTASLAWIEATEDETSLDGRLEHAAALMRAPVDVDRPVDVSLTFGLAPATRRVGRSAHEMVADAELAAGHAARRGGRWQKFTDQDGEEANWQLSLLAELDMALANGEVWNAYQPKFDVASGRIIGVESLVRWNHRDRGPIGPDRFIPVIEANGRAADLTLHVLRQALDDARTWAAQGHPIGVAVNVSATLLADHGFIETVREALSDGVVAAERVTIEVTESAAMLDPDRAIAALESWRALGINISIDDYGTGQSSLAYLQRLPATELKIDKSFVQTIAEDRRNAIMVRSTVAMAHELGMKVVAEGVEDAECLRLLAEMHCDTAQGFFVGRPMSADALAALLGSDKKAAA
jgi:EAL domain-containing protein (putative c-di-GMP-specific phosphodiesterase class I)/CHASE2 domain-containing sensor protein